MIDYEEELRKEIDRLGEPCKSRGLISVGFAQRLIAEINSVNRRLAYRIRDVEKLKAELKSLTEISSQSETLAEEQQGQKQFDRF